MTTPAVPQYQDPMQESVARMMRAMGQPDLLPQKLAAGASPGLPLPQERLALRVRLIQEEAVVELLQAALDHHSVLMVDALVDGIVVALGALVECGIDVHDVLPHDWCEFDPSVPLDTAVLRSASLRAASGTIVHLGAWQAVATMDPEAGALLLGWILLLLASALVSSGVDPQPFFDEVQRANFSKLDPVTGLGIFDEGGKFTKGPDYVAPDLEDVWDRLHPGHR